MNKEELFECYLQGKISESEVIKQLDILETKIRKKSGVIYTPLYIVQKMIDIAKPTIEMKIIEPSCGHGIFLIGLLEYIYKNNEISGNELYIWFKNNVTGIEISKNTVNELREFLALYFKKHFKLVLSAEDFENIVCNDGLLFNHTNIFDLCIGNPPYIRAKNLDNDYLAYLKKTYLSCSKGAIDIYFAFIEKYLKNSKKMIFITPNGFLSSKAGNNLKEQIIPYLSYLIDFKERKVFNYVGVYTCIFEALSEKKSLELIYGTDFKDIKNSKKSDIFNKREYTDGLFDTVLSSIATLADNIYLVKKSEDGKYYASFNKEKYEIEEDFIAPYLKITKIKSQNDIAQINYMIYPYNDDKTIKKEVDIAQQYPLAYKYLLVVKEELSKRDKGNTDKYEAWYAYGRRQGLYNIKEEKIIMIPRMIGGQCKPLRLDISGLLKTFNKIVFTSGYIIQENQFNKEACELILKQDFVDFAISHGKLWPGKNENYYTLSAKQIKSYKNEK